MESKHKEKILKTGYNTTSNIFQEFYAKIFNRFENVWIQTTKRSIKCFFSIEYLNLINKRPTVDFNFLFHVANIFF